MEYYRRVSNNQQPPPTANQQPLPLPPLPPVPAIPTDGSSDYERAEYERIATAHIMFDLTFRMNEEIARRTAQTNAGIARLNEELLHSWRSIQANVTAAVPNEGLFHQGIAAGTALLNEEAARANEGLLHALLHSNQAIAASTMRDNVELAARAYARHNDGTNHENVAGTANAGAGDVAGTADAGTNKKS